MTLTPGNEGSDEACRILLLLNRYPTGLRLGEMGALLQIESKVMERALLGLKTRHRVVAVGKGSTSMWMLKRYAEATHE
jgi:hypothetical protein